MALIEQMSFRSLANKFLILKNPDPHMIMIVKEAGCPIREDNNAMLLYGYIDHEAGLTFEFICMAYIYNDGRVTLEPRNIETSTKFRYGSFSGDVTPFINIDQLVPYMDISNIIDDGYKVSSQIMEVRKNKDIDELRAPGFPDDLLVIFYKPDEKMEGIWCRVEGVDRKNNTVKGKLLNQPWVNYGINIGDIVDIIFYNVEGQGMKAFAKLWNEDLEYD
jgi:hypothetical protein